ncbi:hypothetical protein ROHU_007260 [Labeo rohita]|uniref:Uncharacterized protein n=1 Tax=Labeo rohita TaxID=84645 RepID=A0A498MIG7_LABRO|nr:hypothetical protein ROHU_007260 [Labeo rohita]
MKGIIPKKKTKGTDFCGVNDYYYIIRSDLGCYMQSSNFNKGLDITILSLHPACQNGDHYFGSGNGYFYIIKGKSYRRVSNLTTDSDGVVYSLHPNCQGGDHYLGAFGKFYIIFQGKGTYRRTTNLNQDSDAVEYPLHPNCRDGLYYWGLPNHYYFLKPASEWGVEYYKGTNFNKDECTAVYSVHPDILNFLPGGLSMTKGPAFGIWENIKTITNDSNTPVTWQKKIIKRVGYNKEKMTEITHNWKIAMTTSAESKDLLGLIAKCQFSLSTEYGGSHVSTENESWNEATEVEENLTFELKPNERLYLWQYKLGLGQESVLFCRDLKIDDEPNPPTEVPLPPANVIRYPCRCCVNDLLIPKDSLSYQVFNLRNTDFTSGSPKNAVSLGLKTLATGLAVRIHYSNVETTEEATKLCLWNYLNFLSAFISLSITDKQLEKMKGRYASILCLAKRNYKIVTVQGVFPAPLAVCVVRQLVVWAISADGAAGVRRSRADSLPPVAYFPMPLYVPTFPFLAGCLEVKCPFKYRSCSIQQALDMKDKDFCLQLSSNNLQLKRDHRFYTQIQTPIFVTQSNHCDLVVWTEHDFSVVRVFPDQEFWEPRLQKAQDFFKKVCLPELAAKYYSKDMQPHVPVCNFTCIFLTVAFKLL